MAAKGKAVRLCPVIAWVAALGLVPALTALWVSGAGSATYSHTLAFSQADLCFSRVGDYDLVGLAGARWTTERGKPRLPMVPVRVGLPAASRVVEVSVVACDSVIIPGRFMICPSQPPLPLASAAVRKIIDPDPSIYQSDALYPDRPLELAGAGRLADTRICEIVVHPLRYRPSSGELVLYTSLTFTVDYQAEAAPAVGKAASEEMTALAARLLSAPSVPRGLSKRPVRDLVPMGGSDVAYLIVTSETLKASFEPLREWKMRKGLASEIVTIETIIASFTGSDLQEKIRNAIKYYYANCGTEWVLLGGDSQVVPDRKVYVNISDRPYLPCDLYYSDLDGTWNADNDLYWGETPSDDVDMYADVFVGRAPVATAGEAETFVRKVLTYEGFYAMPGDYQLDMLFLGEVLWGDPKNPSDPDYTDAGIAKNIIDDAYVPPIFSIEKLYQSEGNLSRAGAIASLDQGMGLINVLTHGHYKSINVAGETLGNDDFLTLASDSRYGLMYSAACLNGGFDQNDCIGEAWVLSAEGGGFFIGNSRYGWGTPGEPGEGPSDYYDQSFFESVFSTGFVKAGKAHADAKHEYVGESRADAYMRYLMYGLNLLGDPETSLWTSAPANIVVSCPAAIDTSPQVFPVSVTSSGAPVAGARVCLWKGDDVYVVGETGPDGSVGLPVDASSAGTLRVTVTGSNCLPFLGETSVDGEPPHPARPANLVALEAAGPSVTLAWSAVDDEDLVSYRIFKNTAREPQAFAVVGAPETVYVDSEVAAGTTYYYWVTALDGPGSESPISDPCSVAVQGCVGVPGGGFGETLVVALAPNPFTSSVRLVLDAAGEEAGDAPSTARVLGVDGRCVAVLDLGGAAGHYEAIWDGRDASGRALSPGLYFVLITLAEKTQVCRVMLLR